MFKVNKKFIPCHDVVFSMMFEDSDLFKQLVKAVTGKEVELIDTPFSQISKRETVTLSSVRFDLFAKTEHGMFSVDMQRSYGTDLINRIVFYACRLISTQNVVDMKYSELQPINVSFIMAEKPSDSKEPIRYIKTVYTDTGEPFSDLLNVALVYVPSILKTADSDSDIRIFAEFFSIKNNDDAEKFEIKYQNSTLGDKLMREYSKISFNEDALRVFANDPYYTDKDYERITLERERAAKERDRERVKILADRIPVEELATLFNMPITEVRRLAE
jgi:predicted transposase/invertase (TIGR01784 family)